MKNRVYSGITYRQESTADPGCRGLLHSRQHAPDAAEPLGGPSLAEAQAMALAEISDRKDGDGDGVPVSAKVGLAVLVHGGSPELGEAGAERAVMTLSCAKRRVVGRWNDAQDVVAEVVPLEVCLPRWL